MTRILDRLFQVLSNNSQQRLSYFLAGSEGWIRGSGKHVIGGLYNIATVQGLYYANFISTSHGRIYQNTDSTAEANIRKVAMIYLTIY